MGKALPLVLIVDDEEDIRDVVGIRLRRSGYTVITARNGEEGVRLAGEKQPQIILMDIRMPRMNGLEATRALRLDARTKAIPVILLTASVRDDAVENGFRAGADAYIKKPFMTEDLLERMESLRGGRPSLA